MCIIYGRNVQNCYWKPAGNDISEMAIVWQHLATGSVTLINKYFKLLFEMFYKASLFETL